MATCRCQSRTQVAAGQERLRYRCQATMRRAALSVGANRITLLHDKDRDGVAGRPERFVEGLDSSYGVALVGRDLLSSNTDG